jgi:hypothetical protein
LSHPILFGILSSLGSPIIFQVMTEIFSGLFMI